MAGKESGVAVIGSGRMGTLRANLVSTYPSTRFVGVADIADDAAQKLGKSVNANVITTDIDALIHHPDVNSVIASTPEGLHRDAAIKALRAGKSVLVEKDRKSVV